MPSAACGTCTRAGEDAGPPHYRTSYGQNVLQHSIEVSHRRHDGLRAGCGCPGCQAGRPAHDLGKAVDHELGTHVSLGVSSPGKYKEREDIIHAIEAHHNDVSPGPWWPVWCRRQTLFSAARPGARRENLRTTSSVWSGWRPSPAPILAWIRPTPSRPAARCGSW